jgi:hypothetical protein
MVMMMVMASCRLLPLGLEVRHLPGLCCLTELACQIGQSRRLSTRRVLGIRRERAGDICHHRLELSRIALLKLL